MKLIQQDYTFNNTQICHIMPKQIELNRVLINLYMLLKYDGRRPVARTGRIEVDIDFIVNQLIERHGSTLEGFDEHRDVIADWIYSDLVDIVNRGIPDRERVASPLPVHLNAYKLRNPKQAQDYRGAEHIYSMLREGDPNLIGRLAEFLGQGMQSDRDTYDEETPLDLDTLTIVRMVSNENLRESPSSRGTEPEPPLCKGQARLLCDDLRCLLAYEGVVPRSVLIGYIRTIFGLHLGLYLLRLFHQVSGWVQGKTANPACLDCPVHRKSSLELFRNCPYAFQNPDALAVSLPEIIIDMGEDYTSRMAALSRDNCARHCAGINQYIHAVFTINQLYRFANSHTGYRELKGFQPQTVAEVLTILNEPPSGFDYFFNDRITDLFSDSETGEEELPEANAIREMTNLQAIDTFVELVALQRTKYYRKYLTEQLDSVLMKNTDTSLLQQGKGRRNQRRWYIGSRLLEALVQIAVLEPVVQSDQIRFRSRPILIDEFAHWLRERYGLVIIPNDQSATIQDYEAFNANLRALKERLREIGFFTDLSDAYNAQKIRPRYEISAS